MILEGRGSGVGCCGELVQGTLPDGCQFQVTLPIDWSSQASVELRPAPSTSVDVVPAARTKAAQAATLALSALCAAPHDVRLSLQSSLPVGAGLGSSTADIVATIRSVAEALGKTCAPEFIGNLAGSIEASDGTMFRGMAVVDRRGHLLQALQWWPSFHLVVLVPREGVDTATVDLAPHHVDAARYHDLLDQVLEGAERRDVAAFVDAARASAELHQELAPNRFFAIAPRLAALTGAVGWNVAHTGSAVGLLYDDARVAAAAATGLRHQVELDGVRLLSAAAPPADLSVSGGARR